jgi:CDP-diacylglycerol---serine O-phosphatidyltransferase
METSPPTTTPPSTVERPRRKGLRRGVYLLPSALTIGNILMGFYGIVSAYRGHPGRAALLVFAAGILDALDGRIARMSGTDSEFGKEYDSLADVFTFGAAPALIAFFWGLEVYGRIGWLIPLFFLVCCATRLARFNVQTSMVDSRFFVGLPAPAAAASICALIFLVPHPEEWRSYLSVLLMAALLVVGGLMVSTFRYHSFKKFDLKERRSYRGLLPVVAVILVALAEPRAFFLVVALLYTVSGPVSWLIGRLRSQSRTASDAFEAEEPEEPELAAPPAEAEKRPPLAPPPPPAGAVEDAR